MTHRQRITILGQHISVVRPIPRRNPIVFKSDLPVPKYDIKPKMNEENSGAVVQIVVRLKNGEVLGIDRGTHYMVLVRFGIDLGEVEKCGWLLENGKYLWR